MKRARFGAVMAAVALGLTLSGCTRAAPKVAETGETAPADASTKPSAPTAATPSDPGLAATPEGDIDLGEDGGHGGGGAHVHGLAALAAALQDNSLTVAIDTPLSNFGYAETLDVSTLNATKLAGELIEIVDGGSCSALKADIEGHRDGDHGSILLTSEWTCAKPEDLSGITFKGFQPYPAFAELEAVYIGADSQNAADLTPDEPTLIFD